MSDVHDLNRPTRVLGVFIEALGWMRVPATQPYFLWPIIFNLVIYGLAFYGAAYFFERVMDYLIPAWLDFIRWLLWPLFAFGFLFLVYMTATLLVNIVGAPFYSNLAEQVWVQMHGELPSTHVAVPGMMDLIRHSAWNEWGRLRLALKKLLPLLLLSCIPGLNVLAAPLWLLYSLWFMAAEYLTYPMEILGWSFEDQQRFLVRRALGVYAFGGMIMLLLLVPLLNLVVPPLAVVAATLLWGQSEKEINDKGETTS